MRFLRFTRHLKFEAPTHAGQCSPGSRCAVVVFRTPYCPESGVHPFSVLLSIPES